MQANIVSVPPTTPYLNGTIPADYKCSNCTISGCKMWRKYQDGDAVELLCASCAAKVEDRSIEDIDDRGFSTAADGAPSDMIGRQAPAIPVECKLNSYWGYSAVPDRGVEWWEKLPTLLPRRN